jgi:hypothetical protein
MQRKAALFIVVCAALVAALACGPLGGGEEPTPAPEPTEEPVEPGEEPTGEKPPPEKLCGDGVCEGPENPENCPDDCKPEGPPPEIDLTGDWMSPEWGALRLVQDGDLVTGTYDFADGQLSGRLVGNRLEFRWWQSVALGQPYEAADPGSRGDAYFDVLPDGNHIEGEWRYEGDADWIGTWTADRQFRQ